MADSATQVQLVLDDHVTLGRMTVDMEAFFEFSFWIAEELEDLKAQWEHAETQANAGNQRTRLRRDRRDRTR